MRNILEEINMEILIRYAGKEERLSFSDEELFKYYIDQAVENGYSPVEAVLELMGQGSKHIRKEDPENADNKLVQAMLK